MIFEISTRKRSKETTIASLLRKHFHPVTLDALSISERIFPPRVRADLQKGTDRLFVGENKIMHFCGARKQMAFDGLDLPELIASGGSPAVSVAPEYEQIDVGEERPIRCLKSGLWLLENTGGRYAVFLAPASRLRQTVGIKFQIATVNDAQGTQTAQAFFDHLEHSVLKAEVYRGKVLSLEQGESFAGTPAAIKVHKLRTVRREQVILPLSTLHLLDRNVIQFIWQRSQLAQLGQATKKGILFYGPPGTGKTHTIHYLAASLPGHTTLLITAEQVKLLSEYMALARLLQPSIVVIEDVDLIAQNREVTTRPYEEILLNRLLNEMDGLTEEADILFILTTNRPEVLEGALASRPGRVDQAIEFPLPDAVGREKLVRLYSATAQASDEIVRKIALRTVRVSGAFIKELMRRTSQFNLERDGAGSLEMRDVENALEEMLFAGGSLNRKLLGFHGDGKIGFA